MNEEDTQYERDHAARRLEVERSFNNALANSGVVLEHLDVTTATRVAFDFFRDARFEWMNTDTDEDTSSCNVTIELEHEPSAPVNPLLALFSKPKPGPLETILLYFERDLETNDEDMISFSLELEFEPDGLDGLEDMDLYTDGFDSFEDFARAVLTHPSLKRLAELRPRSVSMTVV
jgi:hypothetical protein